VQDGGVVRRGVGAGPQKIFPPAATGSAEFVPMDHIFSRLIACEFYGRFDCPTPSWVGDLAESWEVSGPNDSVWVFKLRQNATWHDGEPVTADDVIFTWHYDLVVPGGTQITCPLAQGMGLLGTTEFCEGQAESISGITKVDDYTVQFDFDPDLVSVERPSSWQNVWIVPQHIWEGIDPETAAQSEQAQNPIGSGPFKFVQHLTDQYVELERYPQYYLGQPRLERIFLVIGAACRCTLQCAGDG
jgi:peptide/nickel transport system substrate-binding protein